jgi:hypothetical protein
MTELRELTDAELDIVGGGARPPTMVNQGGGALKLVEEILVDILKILEGNNGRQQQRAA